MAEISTLDGLEAEHITESQIKAMIRKCDIALNNILFGNGTWGAVEYQEFGPAGHKTEPSKLVAELRKTRAMYVDLLTKPEQWGDFAMLLSQWDDPNL